MDASLDIWSRISYTGTMFQFVLFCYVAPIATQHRCSTDLQQDSAAQRITTNTLCPPGAINVCSTTLQREEEGSWDHCHSSVKTPNMIGHQHAVPVVCHHGDWHVSLWLPDAPTGRDGAFPCSTVQNESGNHSWGSCRTRRAERTRDPGWTDGWTGWQEMTDWVKRAKVQENGEEREKGRDQGGKMRPFLCELMSVWQVFCQSWVWSKSISHLLWNIGKCVGETLSHPCKSYIHGNKTMWIMSPVSTLVSDSKSGYLPHMTDGGFCSLKSAIFDLFLLQSGQYNFIKHIISQVIKEARISQKASFHLQSLAMMLKATKFIYKGKHG